MSTIRHHLMPESPRKAELAIVAGFLVLFLIFQKLWLVYVALALCAMFLLSDTLSHWTLWAWFKLAAALGYLNSRFLLSAVFFLLLVPMALLRRLWQRNPLFLHAPPPDSMFQIRQHLYSRSDFEKLW